MFTWDAVLQMTADRRGRMMAEAESARMIHATGGETPVSPARRYHTHVASFRPATRIVASVHRS
jgi:hypothetical protein